MDKELRSVLAWWESVGVDIPDIKIRPARPALKPLSPLPENQAHTTHASPPIKTSQLPSVDTATLAQKAQSLDELRAIIADFDAGEISDFARQSVFSRGNPDADIMVIGEAPGRDEDLQGQPFVGRSGQLLDSIFAAIDLKDRDIYITNIIHWRPPGNRNPSSEEIYLCRPFLMRHIELFEPKIIVAVGGIALSALTGLTGIMKHRGQWTDLTLGSRHIPILPIYHPAFLLRQPALKKDTWRDMLSLHDRIIDLEIEI